MKNIIRKYYFIGVLFLIVVAAGLFIQYSYFNSVLDAGTGMAAEMKRDTAAARIGGSLAAGGRTISALAGNIALAGDEQTVLLEYMTRLQQENPYFTSIYYLRSDNTMINSSGWMPPEGYDLTARPWYVKASEKQRLVFTEAFVNASKDRLIMTIACPVYDSGGTLAGVAAGDVEVGSMTDIINKEEGDSIYSFVIDGKDNVLAYPDMAYTPDSIMKKAADIAPGLDKIADLRSGGVQRFQLNGMEGYLAYQPIDDTDWILASFVADRSFDNVVDRMSLMLLLILISSLILFGLFLLQQRQLLIKPMLDLERDINGIETERDFDYRLPNSDNDIFSEIRNSINAILGKTQQFYGALQEEHRELAKVNEELEAYVQQLKASEQEIRLQYELLAASEKQNAYLSYHDHLTGIYNRRFCEEEIRRLDTERNLPISIIMGDVNGLKLTNDAFGHESGDLLLQKAASAMQKACRSDDIIARWGGDEYVILLPRTKQKEAEIIIGRIKDICTGEKIGAVNLSIALGAAAKTAPDEDIQKIMQNAEDRMYSNKMTESENLTGNAVRTIISTLHEKSPREEDHARRVSELCQSVGKAAGLSEAEISRLEVVGLLHDIGKIAIEESVLNKPGWFTEEEWKKVRLHSEIGFRILSTVNSLSETAEYVLHHHERWDGRGYPKGLKDGEIPVISRIIAIVEAYDVMTNESSYRKAMTEDIAVRQLLKNAGTQFDPDLVSVFVSKVLGRDINVLRS